MSDSTRVDKVLVDLNIAKTRSQAKLLIDEGVVSYKGKTVKKAGLLIENPSLIQVEKIQNYVGRGAFKLLKAIEEFELKLKGKIVLDIGASTGGFTQVSLEAGAKKVYAIDVGHNQLDPSLRKNKNVINLEGVNIREVSELPDLGDLAVADLSFISLKLVLENIFSLLGPSGKSVVLVKPQFEIGKKKNFKGIVKDPQDIRDIFSDLFGWLREKNLVPLRLIPSPILGKSGNREYLLLLSREGKEMELGQVKDVIKKSFEEV